MTIVVPLDGSTHALAALRPAVAFAASSGDSDVLLLSCVEQNDERDIDRALDYLELQADRFRCVVEVRTEARYASAAAEGILETVGSLSDAALCLATRGRGGIRTAVLGSVAAAVIGNCAHPMIVVGPACRSVLVPGERADIVVCSDGSLFSTAVLPVASAWATAVGLHPLLVEVVGPDENVAHGDEAPRNREVEAATERLSQLGSSFDDTGRPPNVKVLHGHAPTSISAFATRRSAALVALTTHGRTGVARVRLGSVATEIVRRSSCPVLLVRPSS